MTDEIRVLYNDTCPLCAAEIGAYRRRAAACGAAVAFDPLDRAPAWGLTRDAAARRFRVRAGGQVAEGLEAFRILWGALPGWRWLARLTGLPLIRPVAALLYDRIAAPALYRAHRRRQARPR